RIASTAAMLTALGTKVEITEDGLRIFGQSANGNKCFSSGTVDSCKDHRLAMAAAIAAIAADGPVWIKDPGAVEKSYPSFFADYLNLGGKIYGVNVG
ncbi:MAG: 3-phosphoshikimate 1-carboxyvinyltransferase, partial [Clostridiales bacterium]|nr:3-phosphoshikimate 1-carboxyvinyltransferase [Clostridiales bacterium]